MKSFFKKSLLLQALIFPAALTAMEVSKDGVKVDLNKLKMVEPHTPQAAMAIGAACVGIPCAVVGAVSGANVNAPGTGFVIGGVFGGAIGGAVGSYINSEYRKIFNATPNHLDINGAAYIGDVNAVQAHLRYYGNGAAETRDANGRTPVMYAAGSSRENADGAAEAIAILAGARPTCQVQVSKGTTRSVTPGTVDQYGNYIAPQVLKGTFENYEEVNLVDLQDNEKNTAAIIAALANNPKTLKALLDFNADCSKSSTRGRTVASAAKGKSEVQALLD